MRSRRINSRRRGWSRFCFVPMKRIDAIIKPYELDDVKDPDVTSI